MIEQFFLQYEKTIAAISAAGTVAAVFVALYLAQRQTRAKLRVYADINLYISSEAQQGVDVLPTANAPKVIMVTIQNVGLLPVSIPYWSSFVWRVLGSKEVAMQNPKEPDYRASPIQLLPGRSASIVLTSDLAEFRTMIERLSKSSRFGRLSRYFLRLTVITEVGDRFSAKIGRSLRHMARRPESSED